MSAVGWHWTNGTLRDGRPVPAVGEPLVHDGPVVMCESGLHASRRVLDALKNAPGPMCHRVECEDVVEEDDDKLVCRRRTILWTVDAEQILREFARRCALDVIDLWDAPDVVHDWLTTGDESLRSAAWAAAMAAVRAAARSAARSAAMAAARSAARDAAWSAAWSAARDAAWSAARDAAGTRHNRRLTAMVSAARGAP